jgi:hypothetical protein
MVKGLSQSENRFILLKQKKKTEQTGGHQNCKLNTACLKLRKGTTARKLLLGLKFPCA